MMAPWSNRKKDQVHCDSQLVPCLLSPHLRTAVLYLWWWKKWYFSRAPQRAWVTPSAHSPRIRLFLKSFVIQKMAMNMQIHQVKCKLQRSACTGKAPFYRMYSSTQQRTWHIEISQWMLVGWKKKGTKTMKAHTPLLLSSRPEPERRRMVC